MKFLMCVLAAVLVAGTMIGCGGKSEIPPAKETKQADPAEMKKVMEESYKKNKMSKKYKMPGSKK